MAVTLASLLATSACSKKSGNGNASDQKPAGAEVNGEGTAHVDESGSESDDGFVLATDSTPISGVNLAFQALRASLNLTGEKYTVTGIAGDGSRHILLQGTQLGLSFPFPVPESMTLLIEVAGRAAVVGPLTKGAATNPAVPVGVVLNPKATLAAHFFDLAIAEHWGATLAARQLIDVLELQRLAALSNDLETRRGRALSESDYAALIAAFIEGNAAIVAKLAAAGASDEGIAQSFASGVQALLVKTAADFDKKNYSDWAVLEFGRKATIDARRQWLHGAAEQDILSTAAALSVLAAGSPTDDQRDFLRTAVFRQNVNDLIAAGQDFSAATKQQIAEAMWTVVRGTPDQEIQAEVSGQATSQTPAQRLAAALAAAGTEQGEVAAAVRAAILMSVATAPELSSTVSSATNSATVQVTAHFAVPVTGLILGGISVENGTADNLIGWGQDYSFDVTAAHDGPVSVTLAAGAAVDAARNKTVASSALTFAYDARPPSVQIATVSPSVTNTSPVAVTAHFSEVVADFSASQIQVTNGVAANLVGAGQDFAFDVAAMQNGPVTVLVLAGAATDGAANGNTASNTLTFAFDDVVPGVQLASATPDPTNGPIHVTAHFSKAVAQFRAGNIVVLNGAATTIEGSGQDYGFDVTATGDGAVTIALPAGAGTDVAGNASAAAAPINVTFDGTPPAASLSGTPTGVTDQTALNAAVSANEALAAYRYKVGAAASIDCANAAGYTLASNVDAALAVDTSALADGAVRICVVGQDLAGNWQALGHATTSTWTKLAAPPPALTGFAAVTGSGFRFINLALTYPGDTSPYAAVKIRRIAGATAPNADCATDGTDVYTAPSFASTTVFDDTGSTTGGRFSYRVCIRNVLGNLRAGNTQVNVQAFDNVPPPASTAFSGASGAGAGQIDLSWTLPGDTSDYAELEVRRIAGATPPNADCGSDGAAIHTFTSFPAGAAVHYTDAGTAGSFYSYRLCAVDSSGNRTASPTAANAQAAASTVPVRYMFISNETQSGNLGGLSLTDGSCAYDGSQIVAGSPARGVNFRKLVGSSTQTMRARAALPANVMIKLIDGTLVATSEAQLFNDGAQSLNAPPTLDYTGVPVSAAVWTGAYSIACNDWTSNAAGDSGWTGFSNAIDSRWWSFGVGGAAACSSAIRYYCIGYPLTYIFATAASYTGNLGGTAGADSICAAAAAAGSQTASLGRVWKALLGTNTQTLRARAALPSDAAASLVSGTMIARTEAQLFNDAGQTLAQSIDVDENGGNQLASLAWSGTGGFACGSSGNEWTSASGADNGLTGATGATDATWRVSSTYSCSTPRHLFCIGQ